MGHGGLKVFREQNCFWMFDLNRKAEMTLCWSLKFVKKRNEQKWDGMLRCHSFPGGSRHCMAFDHKSTNQWERSVFLFRGRRWQNLMLQHNLFIQQYSDGKIGSRISDFWQKIGSSVDSTLMINATFNQKTDLEQNVKKVNSWIKNYHRWGRSWPRQMLWNSNNVPGARPGFE